MKRTRVKVIYLAVALSIAAHFLLGPLVHIKPVYAAPETKPTRIVLIRDVPKPKSTKTPPQKVTAQKLASQKSAQPRAPRLPNHNSTNTVAVEPDQNPHDVGPIGPNVGPSSGPGTAATSGPTTAPALSPTPKPVCSAPYLEASTVNKYAPEMPTLARDQGLSGSAQVQVDLSANGQVLGAKIFVSTGSSVLDTAAMDAARRTTYSPKIVDCDRVPGSYLFRVDFENN